MRRRSRITQPRLAVGRGDTLEGLPTPYPAIEIGQPRLGRGIQAQQLRGLPDPHFGASQLASAANIKARSGFGLSTTDITKRLVGRKTHGRHRIGHSVRHHCQPHDLRHATVLATRPLSVRSPSNRPASVAKTKPMVTQSNNCVPSDSNLNS